MRATNFTQKHWMHSAQSMAVDGRKCQEMTSWSNARCLNCLQLKLNQFEKCSHHGDMFFIYWLQGWWRIALLTNWFCVTTANCMHFICSLYSWGSCPAYLYNFWTCHWRLYLRHRFLLKDVDGRSNSGVVGGQVFQRWAIRDDVRDTSVLAICL